MKKLTQYIKNWEDLTTQEQEEKIKERAEEIKNEIEENGRDEERGETEDFWEMLVEDLTERLKEEHDLEGLKFTIEQNSQGFHGLMIEAEEHGEREERCNDCKRLLADDIYNGMDRAYRDYVDFLYNIEDEEAEYRAEEELRDEVFVVKTIEEEVEGGAEKCF